MTESRIWATSEPIADTDDLNPTIESQSQEQALSSMLSSVNITAAPAAEALHTADSLKRLQSLIYDLLRYSKDSAASKRIERASIHPFCLGPPYLSLNDGNDFLDQIYSAADNTTTIREYLGGFLEGKGYFVCTSHTLAPALVSVFGIHEGFMNESCFKEFYARFCAAARFCGEEVALAPSETSATAVGGKDSKATGQGKKGSRKTGKKK
jgi:hypothetical protein